MWSDLYPIHQDVADSIGDMRQISIKTRQIVAVLIANANANEDLCIVLTHDAIRLATHSSHSGHDLKPLSYLDQIWFVET